MKMWEHRLSSQNHWYAPETKWGVHRKAAARMATCNGAVLIKKFNSAVFLVCEAPVKTTSNDKKKSK